MVMKTEHDDIPVMPTGPIFLAESGPLESRSTTVKNKRREQLRRYDEFIENLEAGSDKPPAKQTRMGQKSKRVKFQDGDVFLSACTMGDLDEVAELLQLGANIDTTSVDGLTALHQAVIDGKLSMVQFLVSHGANLNAQDNEGWTPLHAAACCDQQDIVRFLLEKGADVRLTNSDKELPTDLCENDALRQVFLDAYSERGIDPDTCRHYEEDRMLQDVNAWIESGTFHDVPHSRTGASALHVAAAKGYIRVMNLLLQAGADINARDKDGWTALHAAAHWGEREACDILAEHGADFEAQSHVGHTVMHVVDDDMVEYLQQLKQAQEINEWSKTGNSLQRPESREGSARRSSSRESRNSNRESHRLMSTETKHEMTKKDETHEHEDLVNTNIVNVEVDPDKPDVPTSAPPTQSQYQRPPVKVAKITSTDQVPITSVLRRTTNNTPQQPVASVQPVTSDDVTFKTPLPPSSPPSTRSQRTATPPPQHQPPTSVIQPFASSANKIKKVPSPLVVPAVPLKVDEVLKQKLDEMMPSSPSSDASRQIAPQHEHGDGQAAASPDSPTPRPSLPSTPTRRRDKTPNPWVRISTSSDTGAPSDDELASAHLKLPVHQSMPVFSSPTSINPPPMLVPFTPPAQRDEAEAERKAKSKRERAARRSTQGVTLEQIKAAQEYDPAEGTCSSRKSSTASVSQATSSEQHKPPADPAPTNLINTPTSPFTPTSMPWRSRALEKQTTPDKNDVPPPQQLWTDAPVSALSQTVEQVLSPTSQDQVHNMDLNVTPTRTTAGIDDPSSATKQPTPPTETPSASALRRRPRTNQSARRVPHNLADITGSNADEMSDPPVFDANTSLATSEDTTAVLHAPVSANHKPIYSNTHKSMATVAPTTRTPSYPEASTSTSLMGVTSPVQSSATGLQRVTVSIQSRSQSPHAAQHTLSGYTNKYPAGGVSTASSPTTSGSGITYTTTRSPASGIDYKSLYDRELNRNEALQKKLNELEQQLRRQRIDDPAPNQNGFHKSSDTIEVRKYEQRIQELEGELNMVDQLRADNKRLKDENGALIRVISKLSK